MSFVLQSLEILETNQTVASNGHNLKQTRLVASGSKWQHERKQVIDHD